MRLPLFNLVIVMPEGPEVYLIARRLHTLLQDSTLQRIEIVGGPYLTNPSPKYHTFRKAVERWEASTIAKVRAYGKLLLFHLLTPSGKLLLTSHLGMEGAWCLRPDPHHLLTLHTLKEGKVIPLYFCDVRRFGTFALLSYSEWRAKRRGLGIPILQPFSILSLYEEVDRHPRMMLADLLLDQRILAGIGNYLRADIMYAARLHPLREVGDLSEVEVQRLFRAIRLIPQSSLNQQATTCGDYPSNIHRGSYQCLIYQRKRDSEGNKVEIIKRKGRSIHWVPSVQR